MNTEPKFDDPIEECTLLDNTEAYVNKNIGILNCEIRELKRMLQEKIEIRTKWVNIKQHIQVMAHAQRKYDTSSFYPDKE